jgi:head-tail adaptor
VNAGALNREITVQQKQVTNDPSFGTEIVTWVPLVAQPGSPVVAERFPASVQDILPSRDQSVLRSDILLSRKLVRIQIRWRDDLDSSMRVILHGDSDRTMAIVAGPSEVGGRKDRTEIVCEDISS